MKSILKTVMLNVPVRFNNEFERETLKNNFKTLSYISLALLFVETVMYYYKDSLLNTGNLILYFLIADFIMIPIIWYLHRRIDKAKILVLKIVQNIYAMLCLFFGIGLALVSQEYADLVHMYFMIVFGISFFIYMKSLNSFLLLAFAFVSFTILIPYYQHDPEIVFVIQTNSFIINLFAWLVSRMLLQTRLTLFLDGKLIQEKNNALNAMVLQDSMTKLYNHETALAMLNKEIKRCSIEQPLSIIIADIDNFKHVNDTYGHWIGDQVIKKTAQAIKDAVRSRDYVCRYGGEEFLIIMPDTDIVSAVTCTRRIQISINDTDFEMGIRLTLSGGVSQFEGETMDDLIKKTDEKLYRAKTLGKNRFESTLITDKL